ncbi:ABC transporter substrate-binding protein [Pseudonocardia sp. KRD291]|uniref:ABC transporter substrate-binding protein n=1 Tax=Pseudonocardia sp. KRD291 TaxID=2792007 RepID=UPI001C4A0A09|nr:ABC transporter substrate-binding protein [Pseudonocardia sp. KRD291]MBW0102731.1 ABC transporter substrate-binding protein [Pseudonocardia sp. KRD291]
MTIEGSEGPVTVEAAPSRVVSVGQYRDTDAAVGLGVVPLATPDISTFIAGGISPWVAARLPGAPPELFRTEQGLPIERIAAFAPDLILATDYRNLSADHPTLSRIAPTLSPESGYNRDVWQVTTARVGRALGRTEQATRLVAEVETAIRTAREGNPGFAGRTFTIGPVQANGTVNTVNSTSDASALFLQQLGLQLAPAVVPLQGNAIPGRAVVSPEQLDVLDADVMILTFTTPQARARLEADELFRRIPAVRRGAYIALDLPTTLAIGFPSALSIPFALERSVPRIAAALSR